MFRKKLSGLCASEQGKQPEKWTGKIWKGESVLMLDKNATLG
jgi:hypothetical protein